MKKISKVVGGLLLIAGISACSNSDRNLPLSVSYNDGNAFASMYLDTSIIKGFIATPNPNATAFNYTLSGGLAQCNVNTFNSDDTESGYAVKPSGTTYLNRGGYGLYINCSNLTPGTYSGTVTMTTTSGGYNYSGSLPLTITF